MALKKDDKRIGNQFWRLRSKHGRDKLFASPELLWEAACEYFKWCEENPLYKSEAFAYQGVVTLKDIPIMRAMTMGQLCFYLNCNEAYFRQFKSAITEDDKDFSTIIHDIEQTIYTQKFQGASGNLLNANIIARDLGLADKSEVTGKDGSPLIPARILTKEEAKEFLNKLENEC